MSFIKSLFCKHKDYVFTYERKGKYTVLKMTCPDCGKVKHNIIDSSSSKKASENIDWSV